MAVKVAINGFGRIGRNILRGIIESGRTDIEVVAINDLGPVETNAHLLQFDSVHGRFPADVQVKGSAIDVGRGPMEVTAIRNPADLPWDGVDVVLECTGIFTAKDKCMPHLENGSKRVLISAPGTDADATIVYGVNHDTLKSDHLIVSNGSCTTNCLAPVAMLLDDAFGIETGFMTTIHSYTGDQPTLDTMHKDLYRARAAALSMIPTSTGAAKALGLVLPKLKGKLDGSSVRVPTPNVSCIDLKVVLGKSVTADDIHNVMREAANGKLDGVAIRVPTPNVSVVDLVFEATRETTVEEINAAIRAAADGNLKGILGYTEEPLVSSDFNHDPHSSIFHMDQTKVMEGTMCRILTWYDNEWGFSNRMADTAVAMGKLI